MDVTLPVRESPAEAGRVHPISQVIDELTSRDGVVIATGGGVVLREENRRRLAERGAVVLLE